MIAFVNDQVIICGGIITNFEYCRELRKRGIDAFIVARPQTFLVGNLLEMQRRYPDVPIHPFRKLDEFTEKDTIIANWYPQIPELELYQGKKLQFVQGNDLKADIGEDWKQMCLKLRQRENWELFGVSDYALEWTGREGTVIPNGISSIFFEDYGLERDIDALIEGNNEKNKNIDYAVAQAKKDGHKKIVWFGRETRPIEGVETISSPKWEEIPKLYQRAKHFYKYSLSEGFCLPIMEALVSGCEVHTWNQGHNFPELTKEYASQFTWEKATDQLLTFISKCDKMEQMK